ncbi:MAG: bifunctional diaminohydroxyphosphoribosylaminopyrimidine deaminase/5-amino-6-(5-phosphoribosylamino)uracil reductase RibD [Pseudomonadota bacterium]
MPVSGPGAREDDRRWMSAALALAARAVGRVAPNPAVGALLVRDGRLLARGVTAPGGRPHAEAVALADARARDVSVEGATAYVTLEPCAHHGLTPPCADALAAAGIARLVCPLEDPDPRVSGRGFAALRAAGVAVALGVGAEAAAAVNAGFLARIRRGRPYLTLKLATTLDGRIATASGESRWITGPAARRAVHLMRLRSDAVLIGAGTARADDPALDVRGFGDGASQPLRVVADPRLSLDPAGRLAQSAGAQPVLLAHLDDPMALGADGERRAAALTAHGVQLLPCPSSPDAAQRRSTALRIADTSATFQTETAGGDVPAGGSSSAAGALDLDWMLSALATRGVGSVLAEGGGTLAAALLRAQLVDRLVIFGAGLAIGADGRPAVAGLALHRLADAPRFRLVETSVAGADVMSVWQAENGTG